MTLPVLESVKMKIESWGRFFVLRVKVRASLYQGGAELEYTRIINIQPITITDKLGVIEPVGINGDNLEDIANSHEGDGEHRQQGSQEEDEHSLTRGVGLTEFNNYNVDIDEGHGEEG